MLARRLKADRRNGEAVPLDRTAIVFKHPLPYLYLAAEVFGAAGIPYRASDALPLAAEPTAAAIDLVLDAVASNFTRGTLVALLRSPHFAFLHDEAEMTRESVSALDRALSKARYLGDVERLETLAASIGGTPAPALHAALAAARELAPLAAPHPASEQMSAPADVLDVAIPADRRRRSLRLARAPRARGGRRDADGARHGARRARRSRLDD